jgi:hypothetical protein
MLTASSPEAHELSMIAPMVCSSKTVSAAQRTTMWRAAPRLPPGKHADTIDAQVTRLVKSRLLGKTPARTTHSACICCLSTVLISAVRWTRPLSCKWYGATPTLPDALTTASVPHLVGETTFSKTTAVARRVHDTAVRHCDLRTPPPWRRALFNGVAQAAGSCGRISNYSTIRGSRSTCLSRCHDLFLTSPPCKHAPVHGQTNDSNKENRN